MKCQRCPKQATLHITEVLGEDRYEEVHLCEECAKQKGVDGSLGFSLADLLRSHEAGELEALAKKKGDAQLDAIAALGRLATADAIATLKGLAEKTGGGDDEERAFLKRTLEDLDAHYTGGDQPMSPLNYVWYQYRWQRLAAKMFDADGEEGLVRFWDCFHAADPLGPGEVTTSSLARLLRTEVSQTLGWAIQNWR